MLFTSGLRKAVDQYDPCAAAVATTAEETSRILAEKRRRQMIRRHTCSTLRPEVPLTAPTITSIAEENERTDTMIPPTMPPPMPPTSSKRDSWGSSTFAAPPTHPVAPPSLPAPSRSTPPMDDFDDEWTDDDDNDMQQRRSFREHRLSVSNAGPHNTATTSSSPLGSRSDMSDVEGDRDRGPSSRDQSRRGSSRDANSLQRRKSLKREEREERRRRSTDRDAEESLVRRRCSDKSDKLVQVTRRPQERNGQDRRPSSHSVDRVDANHGHGRISRTFTTLMKDFGSHDGRTAVSRSQSHGGERHGSKVNKSINRFSNFVKSGMEDFILGASKMNGQPGEKHEIVLNGSTVQWKPLQHPYEATIDNPKKETKLKGLKSFIAYSVTSSLRGLQVGRRYKHFDWLHEQLSAKYIMIPIPPLPEKQVSGRYEEDLLEHRQHILQLWVNKICRHPVLSQSEVWLHFLSSTDEKDWKNGKRKAEKDEYVGGNFLHCVSVPTGMLDTSQVERQLVRFQQSVKSTEDAMKVMQDRMKMFQRLYAEPVKVNWQKLGHAMHTLGNSFQADDSAGSAKVSQALGVSSTVFHKIGESYETHARNDWEPVVEALYTYKGTIQSVPDILNVHKQAVSKLRENEGKLSTAEAEKMKERVDAMSYAVLAEVNHLNSEKVEDTRAMMSAYLRRQAAFHQQIAAEMSRLAAQFDP